MSKYVRVLDGLVQEFFETDGDITQMFHPSLIWVNIDAWPAVEIGWIAEKINNVWHFRPWTISPEEILRINTLDKAYKRSIALDPMAMALIGAKVCYYDETGTTPLAKAWQEWYAAWDAVDLTVENPVWPTPPNAVQP
jgi:hypothetical protein